MRVADIPSEMRVVEQSAAGGPDVLGVGRRQVPHPSERQVLVQVAAAGVNGPDLMQRKGLYPSPKGASDLLGLEISGTVISIGHKVSSVRVGDRVCGLADGGGYAEYCVLEESLVLPVPDNHAIEDAAALPETFFTIWSNIFMSAGLKAGDVFLIHGGAGGLGTTAIQLGKAFGATVIATDGPEERCRTCRALGADRTINYQTEDFVEIVRNEFMGADVILDIIGGANIEKNVKASRHDGTIVQLAFAAGSKIDIDLMPIMLKRLSYTGSTLRTRPPAFKAEIAQQLRERVWPKVSDGEIESVVNARFPLEEASLAHRLMESAEHVGKIILCP